MAVIELTSGYRITYDKFGITGQRQFIEGDMVLGEGNPNTGVTVPVIGEQFHDPAGKLNYLICTKIEQQYVENDKRKVLFTCSYSNEPIDLANMTLEDSPDVSIDELPQEFSYSGEYQMWKASPKEVANSRWVWDDDHLTSIANAIPFRIRTFTRTFQKIVPIAYYNTYTQTISNLLGKVNSTDDKSLPEEEGCWLFTGAKSEIFRDQQDLIAYRFELTFQFRDPDGLAQKGWNKILSEVGQWRIPYNATKDKYLYEDANFTPLFSLKVKNE